MTRGEILLALRLALSAFVAIAIAVLLQVPHPFWAAMPVWAMSQPTRGLLLERGLFRLGGTLAGAAAGLGLLALDLPQQSQLLLLCIAVFLLTPLIARMRGALGYAPLMAAMTLCIVMIPSLVHPIDAFGLAAARVECTVIGVVVGLLMGFFLTPPADRERFTGALMALVERTFELSANMLHGGSARDSANAELKLLKELLHLQEEASILGAGSLAGHRRVAQVEELAQSAMELLGAVHAHEQRRLHVRANPPERETVAQAVRQLSRQETSTNDAELLRLAADDPRLARAVVALRRIADVWLRPARPEEKAGPVALLSPYRDAGLALESGLIAAVCTYAAVMLAIVTGLPQAQWAALGVALSAIMMGSHPAPARIAGIVLRGALAGLLVALAYRIFVLPHASSPIVLLASLAPLLLVGGVARAHPRTAAPAFDANQLFLMSAAVSVPGLPAASAVWTGTLALVASIFASCVVFPRVAPAPRRRERRIAGRLSKMLGNVMTAPAGRLHMPVPVQQFFHLCGFEQPANAQRRRILSTYNAHTLAARLRELHRTSESSQRQLLEEALEALKAPSGTPPVRLIALERRAASGGCLTEECRFALLDAVAAVRSAHSQPSGAAQGRS